MATFSQNINWAAVGKTGEISPSTWSHLRNVYLTLTIGILCAAFGSVVFLTTSIGSPIMSFVGLLLIIWLLATPVSNVRLRLGIFHSFCFVEGLSLGPLLDAVLDIDPTIISTALLGTVCVFACFSATAMFARRRSYLFLFGPLSSALSTLLFLNLLSVFFPSLFFHNLIVYGGLIVFSGFIIFDTQLIVEKAENGHKDFITDALQLFLDFVNIFIRLVLILSKNKKKDNKK